MKKFSFKISRETISALALVCSSGINVNTPDSFYNFWLKDTLQELLLKLARYRNKAAKAFKITFNLPELLAIREALEILQQLQPATYESLLVNTEIIQPLNKLVV